MPCQVWLIPAMLSSWCPGFTGPVTRWGLVTPKVAEYSKSVERLKERLLVLSCACWALPCLLPLQLLCMHTTNHLPTLYANNSQPTHLQTCQKWPCAAMTQAACSHCQSTTLQLHPEPGSTRHSAAKYASQGCQHGASGDERIEVGSVGRHMRPRNHPGVVGAMLSGAWARHAFQGQAWRGRGRAQQPNLGGA